MTTGADGAGESSVFASGALVYVGGEDVVSVVVVSADQPCEIPPDAPDLGGLCCEPLALIRTPADESGVVRWAAISELSPAHGP